jgi:hypothetical protein
MSDQRPLTRRQTFVLLTLFMALTVVYPFIVPPMSLNEYLWCVAGVLMAGVGFSKAVDMIKARCKPGEGGQP